MPGEYASETVVPVSRSLEEIKRTLIRFGVNRDTFAYAEQGRNVAIQFDFDRRQVRLVMQLPDRASYRLDKRGYIRTDSAIDRDWEQACRQRWRTLAAAIKAKLAMIDDGISTFEREFLADLLLPSGETIGERLAPEIDEAIRNGDVPRLVAIFPPRVVAIEAGKRAAN